MNPVVSNCYWGNLISGSVVNQLFSSGSIVMHLGPRGNSLLVGRSGKNTNISRISNSVTHLQTAEIYQHRKLPDIAAPSAGIATTSADVAASGANFATSRANIVAYNNE